METHQQQQSRAYRNEKKGMIGGVCEGLGEYFNIDPLIFRIIFIVLVLASGSGVLLYIILWIVLPEKQQELFMEEEKTYRSASDAPPHQYNPPPQHRKRNNGSLIGGLVLIVIGALFLIEKFLPEINFKDYWPLILIVIGIVLVVKALQGRDEEK